MKMSSAEIPFANVFTKKPFFRNVSKKNLEIPFSAKKPSKYCLEQRTLEKLSSAKTPFGDFLGNSHEKAVFNKTASRKMFSTKHIRGIIFSK